MDRITLEGCKKIYVALSNFAPANYASQIDTPKTPPFDFLPSGQITQEERQRTSLYLKVELMLIATGCPLYLHQFFFIMDRITLFRFSTGAYLQWRGWEQVSRLFQNKFLRERLREFGYLKHILCNFFSPKCISLEICTENQVLGRFQP